MVVREIGGQDAILVRPMAYVTLTIDHRVVDAHQTNAWLARFVERLEKVPSNLPEHGNGRRIYERSVLPARVDLAKVAAHYAVSSLFQTYADKAAVYCYTVESHDRRAGARLPAERRRSASHLRRSDLRSCSEVPPQMPAR